MARMMRSTQIICAALACLLPAGCSPSDAGTPPEQPAAAAAEVRATLAAEDVALVWPPSGCRTFSTFDLAVGLGAAVDGRIAVIGGGEPVPEGQAVADAEDVQLLPPGAFHGEVTLPEGKQRVCVQVLDASGSSRGPAWSAAVEYDVVADQPRRVFFVEPKDGATVPQSFRVVFGLEGMGLSPAGQNDNDKTVGHHHVLIDRDAMTPSLQIPADATHLHYGQAQTEATLQLTPGTYQLTMQFADGGHRSYGSRMASSITVHVQ
jgi:hypothetical protein